MNNKLKIYTLGKFSLKTNDINITEGTNIQSKSWELFQYLIIHRHRSISQEEITSMLKLNNNDDPVGSLSSLVYRLRKKLRKAIGSHAGDYIKRSGNAYSFNTEKDYWLDIEELELACELTEKAIEENLDEWKESFEHALELYQGHFLEESNLRSWVWNTRNKYSNLLVLTVEKLAEYLRQQNKYEELLQYYTKVTQLIGFDENLMFGLIESLLRMGKIGLAYQKYQEILNFFEDNNLILPRKLKILKDRFPKNNSDNPEIILEEIKQSLKEEKAYICSQETFTDIFSLETQRSGRDIPARYLVYFRLTGNYDDTVLEKSGNNLFEMITGQLRSGDIVCRWNKKLIIGLLVGLGKSEMGKVMERLHNSFYYIYNIPEDIELKKHFNEIKGKV